MLKLGYLGPEGTFSCEAAERWSGGKFELVPSISITAAINALRNGETERAIVPMENFLGGEVVETVDRLIVLKGKPQITGELVLPITHILLSTGELVKVKKVVSHSQAIIQCQSFLNQHQWEIIETTSTAKAAEIVAEDKSGETAAIASARAGEKYGLEVLASDIGDRKDNVTRFIILGGPSPLPTGDDRVTIFLVTKDVPGGLYHALGAFYYQNINLCKITSRPHKNGYLGKSVFLIEADGHEDDPALKIAIKQLKERFTQEVFVAGSYPKAVKKEE